jgi:hypothetical protein
MAQLPCEGSPLTSRFTIMLGKKKKQDSLGKCLYKGIQIPKYYDMTNW